MAEQVRLLIGGQEVVHDLPLHWAVQEQVDKGVIGVAPDEAPAEKASPRKVTRKQDSE